MLRIVAIKMILFVLANLGAINLDGMMADVLRYGSVVLLVGLTYLLIVEQLVGRAIARLSRRSDAPEPVPTVSIMDDDPNDLSALLA